MALKLVSRGARRVGVAMTATDGSYFYPDEGYAGWQGSHPARIRPPKGVWTVTVEGSGVKSVDAVVGVKTLSEVTGRVQYTHAFTGSQDIIIRPLNQGATCTVVLEESPPLRNCVLARLTGWWSLWR